MRIGSRKGAKNASGTLLLLAPLVFFADLLFFLRCEIIFDVERLPDVFWSLAFDHIGHRFACHVQQAFDVQVIGSL